MIVEKIISMPTIALRGMTILPGMIVHFDVSRKKSIKSLEKSMVQDQMVFVVTQKKIEVDKPSIEDLYKIGTIAKIKQLIKMPNNIVRVLVEGTGRGELINLEDNDSLEADVCCLEDITDDMEYTMKEALMRTLKELINSYTLSNAKFSKEIAKKLLEIEDLFELLNQTSINIPMPYSKKQIFLEAYDSVTQYEIITRQLQDEIEINTIKKDLQEKVKERIDKNQREYILREQMKLIREELGEDNTDTDVDTFNNELKVLKAKKSIKDGIQTEINRFKSLAPNSSESSILRTYIETLLSMPWDKTSKDNKDLKNAAKVLNEDHYGLDKVKERMLEFLAVRNLTNAKGNSPIICLVGPPGVGKTSVAKSVARAINKEYIRISFGGVRDEAEIRGHRKTYVGAMPGRIAAGLKQAGTKNPLMLFDEIDKLGSDYKGDPSSALLEVLDSEQNSKFRDHYVELPIDLSEVLFIATANDVQTIPRPLLDRMELIEVTSYTANEKEHIATDHLIGKQIKNHGLTEEQLTISNKALRSIIEKYTKEAGVRSLERRIGQICRRAAREIVEEKKEVVKITDSNLCKYLGKEIYVPDELNEKDEIGIVTGLAWTSVGGDTLQIEVNVMEGKGVIQLTGKLGDIMKESAQTALSYIRSIAAKYEIKADFFMEHDIHIHVPEGAVPKDGPSAGITMATAMLSAITNTPVSAEIAMTGEITLRGRVLPIGGLKEKILAAKMLGIKKVIVPMTNKRHVAEIADEIKKGIKIIFVDTMQEVIEHSFIKEER